MMNVKYVNHCGQEINLSDWPYIIQSENLFDWEWEYNFTDNRDVGARITAFYRTLLTKNIDIAIYAGTRAEFADALNQFYSVIGIDVADMIPGKLIVGDDYLRCFVAASEKTVWSQGFRVAMYTCKFVFVDSIWTREIPYSFRATDDTDKAIDWGLDYPYDYPYDYTVGKPPRVVHVASIIPGDFSMVVFGPVVNPSVAIGPNTYVVGNDVNPLILEANEWVTIDSQAKSIVKTHAGGVTESVLNLRNKGQQFFVLIPPGLHVVSSNAYLDLTIFEHRSEPPWK